MTVAGYFWSNGDQLLADNSLVTDLGLPWVNDERCILRPRLPAMSQALSTAYFVACNYCIMFRGLKIVVRGARQCVISSFVVFSNFISSLRFVYAYAAQISCSAVFAVCLIFQSILLYLSLFLQMSYSAQGVEGTFEVVILSSAYILRTNPWGTHFDVGTDTARTAYAPSRNPSASGKILGGPSVFRYVGHLYKTASVRIRAVTCLERALQRDAHFPHYRVPLLCPCGASFLSPSFPFAS